MKTRSKLTVGITLIFLTGTLVGVMGTRAVFRHMLAEALGRPSILSDGVENKLDSLSLNPDERDTIMRLLSESLTEIQALREEFLPRFWNIHTETCRKIDSELTPEQRRQFRRLVRDELPLLGIVLEGREPEPLIQLVNSSGPARGGLSHSSTLLIDPLLPGNYFSIHDQEFGNLSYGICFRL